MPQRTQRTLRIPSDQVQGEGSWIELKKYTWAERKELTKRFSLLFDAQAGAQGLPAGTMPAPSLQPPPEAEAEAPPANGTAGQMSKLIDELVDALEVELLERLAGWNWVGDDGEPMPVPQESADLEGLYDDEIQFLFNQIQNQIKGAVGATEAAKN
jgi:hypothetical protein